MTTGNAKTLIRQKWDSLQFAWLAYTLSKSHPNFISSLLFQLKTKATHYVSEYSDIKLAGKFLFTFLCAKEAGVSRFMINDLSRRLFISYFYVIYESARFTLCSGWDFCKLLEKVERWILDMINCKSILLYQVRLQKFV